MSENDALIMCEDVCKTIYIQSMGSSRVVKANYIPSMPSPCLMFRANAMNLIL